MRRAESTAALLPVALDSDQAEPLHRQVYRELARLILGGRLSAGNRLPSSRDLARELGVARNTILAALDQLASEGYVEGRRGAGTFVAADLPDKAPLLPRAARRATGAHGPQATVPVPALAIRARPLIEAHLA